MPKKFREIGKNQFLQENIKKVKYISQILVELKDFFGILKKEDNLEEIFVIKKRYGKILINSY